MVQKSRDFRRGCCRAALSGGVRGQAAELLSPVRPALGASVVDVGQMIGSGSSTAHRLLTTLEASGMISQNTTTRCYEPGPSSWGLARALTPVCLAGRYAEAVSRRPGERVGATVSVVTLHHTDAAFRRVGGAQTPLRVSLTSGRPHAGELCPPAGRFAGALSDEGAPRPLSGEALETLDSAEHSHPY